MIEVGDYEIQFSPPLGTGTYGRVMKGHHKVTREEVAAKSITLTRVSEEYAMNEVQILKLGKDHDNILQILYHKREGLDLWIILEYCELGNLAEYAEKHALEIDQKVDVIYQSTGALVYLLSLQPKAVIHRDIKPANILLKSEEGTVRVRLSDFGLSRTVSKTSIKQMSTVGGSLHYMAPELFAEEAKSDRSIDVFALGILILHLIRAKQMQWLESEDVLGDPIGRFMYHQRNRKELWSPITFSKEDSSVVIQIKWLIGNMVALDPTKRFTMEEVHKEMGKVKDSLTHSHQVSVLPVFTH